MDKQKAKEILCQQLSLLAEKSKVREIAIKSEIPYRDLFGTMYKELESKSGCDLAVAERVILTKKLQRLPLSRKKGN